MKPHPRAALVSLASGTIAVLACSVLPANLGSLTGSSGEAEPGVLFSDDFSDPGSGWDRVNTAEVITDYADGTYQIFVNTVNHDYWAHPGRTFGDVRVEVDATKVGGSDDNDLGVICRYQDTENFYAFLISSDGFYAVMRIQGGDWETVGTDGLMPTDAIRQGATTNQIRADCIGNQLSLYVNGTHVITKEDSAFASGDVGLIAGTYGESGTDIRFDNFFVRQP